LLIVYIVIKGSRVGRILATYMKNIRDERELRNTLEEVQARLAASMEQANADYAQYVTALNELDKSQRSILADSNRRLQEESIRNESLIAQNKDLKAIVVDTHDLLRRLSGKELPDSSGRKSLPEP
jgi:hypothetical protein